MQGEWPGGTARRHLGSDVWLVHADHNPRGGERHSPCRASGRAVQREDTSVVMSGLRTRIRIRVAANATRHAGRVAGRYGAKKPRLWLCVLNARCAGLRGDWFTPSRPPPPPPTAAQGEGNSGRRRLNGVQRFGLPPPSLPPLPTAAQGEGNSGRRRLDAVQRFGLSPPSLPQLPTAAQGEGSSGQLRLDSMWCSGAACFLPALRSAAQGNATRRKAC
jgi:hypothetical protein